jgi:thiosulfate/3-mercaptopyruvate sulfurtransferase
MEPLMRDPNALITTEALAAMLGDPSVRVYDCTTYNNPPPPGVDEPYLPEPGLRTFREGHIPGADFLDLQGEFSDKSQRHWFMRGALQRRHHDVGHPFLVDAAFARLR